MIPQLLLEEILNGEKNEKDFYAKYGKEELQAALAELRKSNEEILSAYPAEAMKSQNDSYWQFPRHRFHYSAAAFLSSASSIFH